MRQYRRIVVKIGTSVLAHQTGMLNLRRLEKFITVISDLQNQGLEMAIVSSGAIGMGSSKLGFVKPPVEVPTKQACAAVGQCELMNTYDTLFSKYNHTVAQLLLSRYIIDGSSREKNVVNTFAKLFEKRVIPIVNENDTVSTDELEFGDNDTLSAIVTHLSNADLLVMLTNMDGLYTHDPKKNPDAVIIPVVEEIDEKIKQAARGHSNSPVTGGMITKITAAAYAKAHGIPTVIANGNEPSCLYDIIEGNLIGTYFPVTRNETKEG